MKLPDLLPSLLRTLVPLIVAWLIGLGLTNWTGLDDDALTGLVTVLLTGAYYFLARLAETYLSPNLGWLLGYAKAPAYGDRERGTASLVVPD